MGFISQQMGDNKCGAYSIAYWEWIKIKSLNPSGYVLDKSSKADQIHCVNQIYNQIKFDPLVSGELGLNEEFSDPKKMIDYLRESDEIQQKGTILYNKNQKLEDAFGSYLGDDYRENVSGNKLPDLNVGDFAILILLDDESKLPQHYVLVMKDESGKVKVIDPGVGDWDTEAWDDVESVNISGFINSGAAIYIKNII